MPEVVAGQTVRVRLFGGVRAVTVVGVRPETLRVRFGTVDGRSVERTVARKRLVEERRPRRAPLKTKRDVIDELEERAIARDRAERRKLRPVPKPPKPARSRSYLAFVRGHACQNCGRPGPSEAAHFGPHGTARKADDYRVNALCKSNPATGHEGCHAYWHQHGTLQSAAGGPMRREMAERYLYRWQVDLLVEWITQEAA